MKHFSIKTLVAAAAFVAAGVANAASITVATDGTSVATIGGNALTATGSGALSFSADLLGALDTGKVTVTPVAPATGIINQDADGYYTEVTASAPLTSLNVDDVTGQVHVAYTAGGATQTAPVLKSVSTGGSLTVKNLTVDLDAKKVFADIDGGNGVGSISQLYLWNIADIAGATAANAPGTYTTTLSGLSITDEGFNTFVKALGLVKLGVGALQTVTDYGTITSTITLKAADVPAVPEASSMAYALVGLGIAGVALRRRAK